MKYNWYNKLLILSSLYFIVGIDNNVQAKEYFVSMKGKDINCGTLMEPLRSINAAARLAMPGDTVTVLAGVYRENVNPLFGGTSEQNRILYRANPGDKVYIKGSEVIRNWKKVNGSVWKVDIDNSFFGNYNPYKDTINADWFNAKGRVHHTGDVYLNGKSLYEVETLVKVNNPLPMEQTEGKEGSTYTWYCESNDKTTTIWANFQGKNPNKELVEINVRPTCFYPENIGIDYITVRGFHLQQAATQWAPPTAEQNGIIGPHWAKGWIIEDNIISDSKCVGISLGKERSTGQNFGVNKRMKSGFQYQLEVVFKAIQRGWSRENVGSHIVRNNVIYNCEQAGIAGHLGCVFSKIYNNHIYNIHTKRIFTGDETAGIKLHAAIDVLIENNRIHDNGTMAMWMDWQCQGTRITGNLMYNNVLDFMTEVNHGPYIVDNNIMLSPKSILDYSQGGAFINNLMTGSIIHNDVMNRYTPYHYPHSTQLAGTSTITGGDDRFYNNIFVAVKTVGASFVNQEAMGAANSKQPETYGLSAYDIYYPSLEAYRDTIIKGGNVYVITFATVEQPVWCGANLYLNGAEQCKHDKGSFVDTDFNPEIRIEEKEEGVFLHINVNESFFKVESNEINTKMLGTTRISEGEFLNPDGTTLIIPKQANVGPLNNLKYGENIIKVW